MIRTARSFVAVTLSVFGILAVVASPALAQKRKPKVDLPYLVELHNKERAKAKLGPLKVNDKLTAAAEVQAKDMADHEKISHEGTDGSDPAKRILAQGYKFERIGENVAQGQINATAAMKAWMLSPHHKEEILRPEFTEIGVACKISANGIPFWAAEFGKPWPEINVAKDTGTMLDAINEARKENKLPPLKINAKLEASAKIHTDAMAEAGGFVDKDPDGKTPTARARNGGYNARIIGQCDASGQPDPKKVVESWLNDTQGSKTVILAPYDEIGIGVTTNKGGVPFWCVILGKQHPPIDR